MHTTVHQASVAPTATTTVHYPIAVQSNASQQPGVSERYNSSAGRTTGWIQLVCGIASILITIIEIILGSLLSVVGYGIWSGLLFYLPTGILGICSHGKNTCIIIAYMVMSIISAQVGFSMFVFQAISAGINGDGYQRYYCAEWGVARCGEDAWNARTAMAAILSIIGIVEMVVAIVGSCYCCGGVCCGRGTPSHQHTVIQYASGTPMVVTAGPQPQPMVYGHPAVQPYQPPTYYQQQQPGYSTQPPPQPGYSAQPPAYPGQAYQQQQPPMYQPSQATAGPSAPLPPDAQPQKA